MSNVKERLPEFLETVTNDLHRCIKFWLDHSHDSEHGTTSAPACFVPPPASDPGWAAGDLLHLPGLASVNISAREFRVAYIGSRMVYGDADSKKRTRRGGRKKERALGAAQGRPKRAAVPSASPPPTTSPKRKTSHRLRRPLTLSTACWTPPWPSRRRRLQSLRLRPCLLRCSGRLYRPLPLSRMWMLLVRPLPDECYYELHTIRLQENRRGLIVTQRRQKIYRQAILLTEMDNNTIHRIVTTICGAGYEVVLKDLVTRRQLLPSLRVTPVLSSPGFFSCLCEDGKIYDENKYGWLLSRQVWTYARIYNEVEGYQKEDILTAAKQGGDFIMKFVKDPKSMRCCLSLTRDGKTIKIQKTIFSECFYAMAMSELYKATKTQIYKDEAINIFEKIIFWVQQDDSELTGPKLPGHEPINQLAVPMMLFCVNGQMESMDSSLSSTCAATADWCIKQILPHVQRNGTAVLENVSLVGTELTGSAGRLMNPGHAIEAGWFLLKHAVKTNDEQLKTTAINKFMVNSFDRGWDEKHGGIVYFVDVEGLSPTQLEWDMKLWWPHNEALISFLMPYKETGDIEHLQRFAKVLDWSYSHFVDYVNGEWHGYLNRQGQVTHNFKGGPWKGCFHVPRCLMMCQKMLQELQ
ncbi:N-acylglucosamine 2-epimerase-like [Gigantopelta aegis]|uniref:N-acylglucosamine 2-epimerase-like n=1 Tax=Gigantopelta aegis TaxID=1735272 RepID=UPI001B88E477|nr:N-acylglucosamine 2-epimerase-like [Gigantopelta aegis]